MEITSAAELEFDQLVSAFNAGYEGYVVPLSLSAEQIRHHIESNSIHLSGSRIARLDGQVVGVALLGRRQNLGWIGGIGVVMAHRGQGIGRKLMQAVLGEAKNTGVTRVYLEVIVGNEAAHKLYQSLGFETLRRLLIIGCEAVKPTQITGIEVKPIEVSDILKISGTSWKPWQRQNAIQTGNGWGAFQAGELRAYVVGHVTPKRIGFNDAGGETNALQAVIAHLHSANPEIGGTFVNLGEDESAWPVFAGLGYSERMAQYEMALDLA